MIILSIVIKDAIHARQERQLLCCEDKGDWQDTWLDIKEECRSTDAPTQLPHQQENLVASEVILLPLHQTDFSILDVSVSHH